MKSLNFPKSLFSKAGICRFVACGSEDVTQYNTKLL